MSSGGRCPRVTPLDHFRAPRTCASTALLLLSPRASAAELSRVSFETSTRSFYGFLYDANPTPVSRVLTAFRCWLRPPLWLLRRSLWQPLLRAQGRDAPT